MSVMWLVLPLAAMGLGEEMHFRVVVGAVRRLTDMAAGQCEQGEDGECVLDAGCAGSSQFWVLLLVCDVLQVSKQRKYEQEA